MKAPFILALLASAAAAQAAPWQALTGDSSRIAAPRAVVVTNPGAWEALWKEHAGDAVPAPEVDFAQEKVVAVFLGRRNSSGYKVELDAAPADPATLVVTYAEKAPSGFAATMMTTPFAFRKLTARQVRLVAKGADAAAAPRAAAPAPERAAAVSADLAQTGASVARMSDLKDAVAAAAAFDGSAQRVAANGPAVGWMLKAGTLPPPPGGARDDQQEPRAGKPLPPPPGGSQQEPRRGGKPLPPPPGQDHDGGKPLPPPPGQGKPLPPPPGASLPQPLYPGGPLSKNDARLEDAERTYTTQGLQYLGYWFNGTDYAADRGVVRVGPNDAGKTFVLRLDSPQVQKYIRFYRDPQDGAYYWVPDSDRTGRVVSRRVEVSFGPRTLRPWESESFSFSLEGRDLALESQNGAYQYTLSYSIDPLDPERVSVTLNPGAKRLTAPDQNGVSARLEAVNGGLKLVVEDKWAADYAGETLELAFVVRQDDGSFWSRDPVVLEAQGRNPSRVTGPRAEFDVPAGAGRGTFYLESWSFRRAGSKLSTGDWVYKGQGNTVKK